LSLPKFDNLIIEICRRIGERLVDIFAAQLWVVLAQFISIRALRKGKQHAFDGQASPFNAWLSVHHGWIYDYPVEVFHAHVSCFALDRF